MHSQVPVGRGTLGRIMNVIGEPVDEQGPIGEQFSLVHAVCGSLHVACEPCLSFGIACRVL